MPRQFDPFREMDRLFTDPFPGTTTAAMPMDLYREGETFTALIDLPGVDPATIDIDVEDRMLTVRASRKDVQVEGAKWLSHERPSGTFARQLSLGRGLALDKIEADYRDGVLRLSIPVAEEAKPRKITVSHSGAGAIEGSVG
ncbi:Hsp20/alpha crystallin family protein [Intrasporangium sp.]|uniref:Hsp20/alpha crystallin family protein n=1 Tax=Intrasporangium sp. TaxID=1925024 RepID=UPI003221F302